MDEYFAKDIMKSPVITVSSLSTVKDAAKMMEDSGIGCVVVMEENLPIGILTERDFVRRVVSKEKPASTSVKEVMSAPLITISPDETTWELAELMKQKKIHRVPVVDKGQVIGIATASDITRLCSIGSDSEMRKIIDQILLRMRPTANS